MIKIYMFVYENTGFLICFDYDEIIKRTITRSKTLGRLTYYQFSISNLLLIKKLVINSVVIPWYVVTQNSTLMKNHLVRTRNSEARANSEGP